MLLAISLFAFVAFFGVVAGALMTSGATSFIVALVAAVVFATVLAVALEGPEVTRESGRHVGL